MNSVCDVSIEFSHLYADQILGRESDYALSLLRLEKSAFLARGMLVSSVILLDDIHVARHRVKVEHVENRMRSLGEQVDAVIAESALRASAKRFITTLPKGSLFYEPFRRARKRVLFARTPEGAVALGSITSRPFEPTCALLIAAWNLARLGRIEVPGVPHAERVVSILEERYREVERKALALISLSSFSRDTDRISHRFY